MLAWLSCYFVPILTGLLTAAIGGAIGWYLRQDKFDELERNNKKLTKDYSTTKSNYLDLESQYSSYKLRTEGEIGEFKLKNQSISAKLKTLEARPVPNQTLSFLDGEKVEVREVIKEVIKEVEVPVEFIKGKRSN